MITGKMLSWFALGAVCFVFSMLVYGCMFRT